MTNPEEKMNNDSIYNKIIDATIECIGKVGIQSVTNRLVAKEANVNSAAINYYFGSKENLINEAVKSSLDNYLSEFITEPLGQKQESSAKHILEQFLTETLKDALSSPFFIKSYLYEPIVHSDYSGIFVERFNTFLNRLYEKTDVYILGESKEEIKMSILQIISSIMFISLLPDFFEKFLEVDLKESIVQKKLIDLLLKRYCIYEIDNKHE
jgi:TetR/AcrR family transcriptional regulator, regulator of cefoperazone and chloramphenicol sensitivity